MRGMSYIKQVRQPKRVNMLATETKQTITVFAGNGGKQREGRPGGEQMQRGPLLLNEQELSQAAVQHGVIQLVGDVSGREDPCTFCLAIWLTSRPRIREEVRTQDAREPWRVGAIATADWVGELRKK